MRGNIHGGQKSSIEMRLKSSELSSPLTCLIKVQQSPIRDSEEGWDIEYFLFVSYWSVLVSAYLRYKITKMFMRELMEKRLTIKHKFNNSTDMLFHP